MTRREWLEKNPPPKAAGALRELLMQLTVGNDARQQLETNKQTYAQHVVYWNHQAARARFAIDTSKLNHANALLADIQAKIAEIDKQLAATAGLAARIAELQRELAGTAKCPLHRTDLQRHVNRPDDLFICAIGPHFFLWTKYGEGGRLSKIDLNKPLPDLDGKMDWI